MGILPIGAQPKRQSDKNVQPTGRELLKEVLDRIQTTGQ
jgi:hypothetical protein